MMVKTVHKPLTTLGSSSKHIQTQLHSHTYLPLSMDGHHRVWLIWGQFQLYLYSGQQSYIYNILFILIILLIIDPQEVSLYIFQTVQSVLLENVQYEVNIPLQFITKYLKI